MENGVLGCGNRPISYLYFSSFIIFVGYTFLNLFIAIILEGFSRSSIDEDLRIKEETINKFRRFWLQYDPSGKGFINVNDFEPFVLDLISEEIKIKEELAEEYFDRKGHLISG